MMLQVVFENGRFQVKVLQTLKPSEGLASEQQTPIYYQGRLFAILPKDGGVNKNQFVCCDPADVSRPVWTSGKTNRFGMGPYILADKKFLILSDEGELTMIKADTRGYFPLAKAKILDGADAWGPLALAGTKLLARDSKKMVCIELSGS
jgi:outer membrane protein assembly factor BamB